MIVKCITNLQAALPEALHEYALTQNKEGQLDISVGKCYAVFATRKDKCGDWYFVHTDTKNVESLWWMPARLYELVDTTFSKGWVAKTVETDEYHAYPSLYDWTVSEGIIDGDRRAIQTYMSQVKVDPSFPNQERIDACNQSFYEAQRYAQYETDLKLAKERGWEWPGKPE